MPLLLISKLKVDDSRLIVEVPSDLYNRYPMVFGLIDSGREVKIRIYVNLFYNENREVVKEHKQLFILPLEKHVANYYIDFTQFHVNDGIPVGYFVDVLLINFIITTENGTKREIPIFPNEYLVKREIWMPDSVSRLTAAEEYSLKRISRDIEVIGLLYDTGLSNIATDLVEALTRHYMSDYEGAIKFFRKVVEGLRNYVQSNRLEDMGENRQEFLRSYLSKAYHLISNFGEHSGTYGFMPEAVFSKDIAVSSCRYIITYLKRR